MDIFKLSIVSIIVCLLSVTLKQYKPEFSLLLTISFGVIALAYIAPYAVEIIEAFYSVGEKYAGGGYVGYILKITGITYLAGFTSEICRDCGENGTASKIELAAKIFIILNTMPIILEFIKRLEEIMR